MMTETTTTEYPVVFVADPESGNQHACLLLQYRTIGEYEGQPVSLMLVDYQGTYYQVLRYSKNREDFIREVEEPVLPDRSQDETLLTVAEWVDEFNI